MKHLVYNHESWLELDLAPYDTTYLTFKTSGLKNIVYMFKP